MSRAWIAVASAEHVRFGRQAGFMQVCHGKAGPLKRIKPNDRVIYYSPTEKFGDRAQLQAFTAIGKVGEGPVYQVDMCPGFSPWRRDVIWWPAKEVPIRPMLNQLSFTRGQPHWGYQFRFGLLSIEEADADLIAAQMSC